MKDKRSLLLLVVSLVLVLTWVYHFYDKTRYLKNTREVHIRDSTGIAKAVTDSLEKILSKDLERIDSEKLHIDSAKPALDRYPGFSKMDSLKSEVDILLTRKNLRATDINRIRINIREMQNLLTPVPNIYDSIENVRTWLGKIVSQLNYQLSSLQEKKPSGSSENKIPATTKKDEATFIVSDIKFSAVYILADQKNVETSQAAKAEKLSAYFVLRNRLADFSNAEIIVVIIEPSGKTLIPEVWEAGSFDTKTKGRKAFTQKINFDYKKGEFKRLHLTIQPDQFEKGIYKLILYQNGFRAGYASLKLD